MSPTNNSAMARRQRIMSLGSLAIAAAFFLAVAGCQWTSHAQNSEGVQLFQQSYYEGALQRFQQALQTDPTNPDSYYNLAATYHRLGKLHSSQSELLQAESFYHQCLDRSQFNHPDCFRGLAVLLAESGRTADAYKLLDDWAIRNPGQPVPRIELARLYEEAGEREAAKQQLLEAIAVDPVNSRALAALGRLREETGDPNQALANYERSLQLNPNQPQLAERVASLRANSFSSSGGTLTPPGGTRTVNTSSPPLR